MLVPGLYIALSACVAGFGLYLLKVYDAFEVACLYLRL